jgi:hypothetical protein
MPKSAQRLQYEINLREKVDQLSQELTEPRDEWDRLSLERNANRLAAAIIELDAVRGYLEWSFAGRGVYAQSISLGRLAGILDPLGQSLRWIARDLQLIEGGPPPMTDLADLVEPVLTDTFRGSFGIRVAPPPVTEQLSLVDAGSLFERAASRLVQILSTAQSDDVRGQLITVVLGLRSRSVSGLRRLTFALAEGDGASYLRWKGGTPIRIAAADAQLLHEILEHVEPTERQRTIEASLQGGDLSSRQFHLVAQVDDEIRHYRGKAEESTVSRLVGLGLGSRVRAVLTVIETDSPLLSEPRETYVLAAVEPI